MSTSASLTTLKPLTMWITTKCGKFLKRWEYQITLPASWEICMQVKKQQNWTWNSRLVQNWEGAWQGCILSPCLFYFYAEYIMWSAGLGESQAGIKIAGRNTDNLRYADHTTLRAESEEELKSFLMKVKEKSEKTGLKCSIQKTKIIAPSLISSCKIDGKKWKQWQTLFSWAPKSLWMVTVDMNLKDACSLKRKLW